MNKIKNKNKKLKNNKKIKENRSFRISIINKLPN